MPIPIATAATVVAGIDPYRTTTTATVTASGRMAAATHRIPVADANFASQIPLRETGLEAVQASVPLSRSAVISAITAKTAAMTKTCVETGPIRLASGSNGGSGFPSVMLVGRTLISQAFSDPWVRNRALTRNTIHERRPRRHSVSSLRTRAPKPGRIPTVVKDAADAVLRGEIEAVMLHAPCSPRAA